MHRIRLAPVLVLVSFAALLGWPAPFAGESDGFTAIRYEWAVGPPAPGKEAVLRVSVEAVVPVEGLVARYAAPAGVGIRPEAGAPLTETGVLAIGAFKAREKRLMEIAVRAPEKGGGIVAFRFAGERNGVRFEEGFGLPVGQVGVEPRLVDGALEFPSEESRESSNR